MSRRALVLEHPLVPKGFIIESLLPGVPRKSDSPLRRLKEKGLATEGIEVRVRRPDGAIGGTLSLYCALNVDAARLERRGEMKKAQMLVRRAKKIEQSKKCLAIASMFRLFRLHGTGWSAYIEALDESSFRAAVLELADDVQKARADVIDAGPAASVTASVAGFRGTTAYLETADGTRLGIPRRQLAEENLDWIGAPVIITREELGSNVILQVKPGLAADVADPVVEGDFITAGTRTDERIDPFAFAGLTFATPEASEAFETLLTG
jgi:hypothetical protein